MKIKSAMSTDIFVTVTLLSQNFIISSLIIIKIKI